MYEERTYRDMVKSDDLVKSTIAISESDLCILAESDVAPLALDLLFEARRDLECYIERDEKFKSTLRPHEVLPAAPLIARRMALETARFNVGPMAAVAGAVAEYVGEGIEGEIIVENGGDIYARSVKPLTVDLFAGRHSKFTGRVKFRVTPDGRSMGIATSSATVGPSLSFGKADAVCIVSDSAITADAAATAFCNKVQEEADVEAVLEEAMGHEGVKGIIIAIGDKLGAKGDIEFI